MQHTDEQVEHQLAVQSAAEGEAHSVRVRVNPLARAHTHSTQSEQGRLSSVYLSIESTNLAGVNSRRSGLK